MRRNLASRRRPYGHVAAGLMLLATVGCSKPTASVTGKVTYKGTPLTAGAVTFHGEGGWVQSAWIDADGTYTIDRAPVGAVKVSVVTAEPRGAPALASKDRPAPKHPGEKGDKAPAGKPVVIPDKYKNPDRSGLTFTLVAGPQTIPIDLQP